MTSIEPIDVTPASPQMDDGHQPTIDELEEINIGTSDDPHLVFISKHLFIESKEKYKRFLSENRDVFACSYEEMLGLDPSVEMHRLAMEKNYPPVKQGQRRYRPELLPQIEVDFMDLNKACLKDDFFNPISEILTDSTMGYEIFSFMDGFSGYNQIKMAPKVEELTAF
jgi:hypothetical protein